MEDVKKVELMEDLGAWTISEEILIKVKNFDIEAIKELFNANYKIFLGMARKYAYNQRFCNYEIDELLNQIFIDLPYYDYSSRASLWYCIVKGSFYCCNVGGYTQKGKNRIKDALIFSYDAPITYGDETKESGSYLLDKCGSTPDAYTILMENKDREEKDEELLTFLEHSIKNKKDLNIMFCQLFTDLALCDIKGNEYEHYKQRKI